MSWTSALLPPSQTISAQDPLPDHLLQIFSKISVEQLSEFNEFHPQIYQNILTNTSYQQFNEYLIDLIGCLIYGKIHSKHILTILQNQIFQMEMSKSLLTDVVWFWGTQISHEAGGSGGQSNKPSEKWQRLCTFVKDLFINKVVEMERLKKSLELNLLVGSGLWHDEPGLQKKLVKINTSLVYRQDKYNLLREETEGYSKLLTVLSTMPTLSEDPSSHIKNVFSIIDPNRVLDLILETMEHQIWNLSFLLLLKQFRKSSIAHILGFKFTQFKTTINGRETAAPGEDDSNNNSTFAPQTPTPQSLYVLTAILLTAELVPLNQILPYFSPNFDSFKVIVAEKTSKLQEEIKAYGVVNLTKKSEPISRSATPSVVAATDPPSASSSNSSSAASASSPYADGYQLIGLLAATLTVRNWTLAQELIQLIKLHTNVDPFDFEAPRASLIALIDWKIDIIYQPFGFQKFSFAGPRLTSLKKDSIDIPDLTRLPLHAFNEEEKDDQEDQLNEGSMEIVQSELMKSTKVQCSKTQTIESFVHEISSMLFYLGHNLSSSPSLYTKLCRLLKSRLENLNLSTYDVSQVAIDLDSVETDESEILNIFRIFSCVLLPSLSRIDCNPAISALCWSVISLFPFNARFTMYGIWKGDGLGKQGIGVKPLEIAYAEAKTLQGAKTCLKRLSKENTKAMGRQLAKHTHSCPLVVFNQILNQIEVYDNMIPFVVEALKYTTELARDVMAYALLSQLRKDSNKLKPGDTHYSGWFSALSKFIGSFYKRYPSTELFGLLHYLLERMSTGSSLDLLVLKELLGRMGGCDTLLDVSSQQLEGLAGGRTLQGEVMGAQVKDNVNKKAVKILRDTMLSSGTALPLLLFIAQSRSNILYQNTEGSSSQLKLISYLYDTCQDVLMQFTDFLLSSGSNGNGKGVESLVDVMPPMRYLLSEIGLAIPIAFQLIRPLVRAALQYGDNPTSAPVNLQQWHPFSNEMKEVVCQHLPSDIWCAISPELYLTFWSLSLYDVFLPKLKYETEIKRLKEKYTELDQKNLPNEDRLTTKQRRNDMTKLLNITNTLKEELDNQRKHIDIIRTMIINFKRNYLTHVTSELSPKTTEYIMQYCLFSRVILSPTDAIFCSQFFMLLHTLETPGFSTIHFIDKTMKTVAPLIFCSTEYEASFIGFYITDLLEICNRWIVSKTAYNKEARSKCGMEKTFGAKGIDGRATHEEYLNVCKIWHKKLSSILVACLKSSEYMHIRSALVFLSKVVQQFPTRTSGGKLLLTCIEGIDKEDNDKEDLKIMAKSVASILKKRSSTWIDDEPKEKTKRPLPPTNTHNTSNNNPGKKGDDELKGNASTSTSTSTSNSHSASTSSSGSGSAGGGKSDLSRPSLPSRNEKGSNPSTTNSSSMGATRNRSDNPSSSSTSTASAPSSAPTAPSAVSASKTTQNDKQKDDLSAPSVSRSSSSSDLPRNKDSSSNDHLSHANNGNADSRQGIRPNKRGREEESRPPPSSNPPSSSSGATSSSTSTSQNINPSNSDKGRPIKSNPIPRNAPSSTSSTSNTQESDANATKRLRTSGSTPPVSEQNKSQDPKINKPGSGLSSAPSSNVSSSTNSQSSHQNQGRNQKESSSTNTNQSSTSTSVSQTSNSQSAPPLSDIEKREQRFGSGSGNRGGVGGAGGAGGGTIGRGSVGNQNRGHQDSSNNNNSSSNNNNNNNNGGGGSGPREGNSNNNNNNNNERGRDSNPKGVRRN